MDWIQNSSENPLPSAPLTKVQQNKGLNTKSSAVYAFLLDTFIVFNFSGLFIVSGADDKGILLELQSAFCSQKQAASSKYYYVCILMKE